MTRNDEAYRASRLAKSESGWVFYGRVVLFCILALVFLPFAFGDLGFDGYVLGAGLMAMMLWVKPWWWRQATWEKSERGWGR